MILPFDQMIISTGDITTVDDPSPFSIQAAAAGLPSTGIYAGGVGNIFALDHAQAALVSNSTNVQYGGYYQYVKANTALARGDVVAWLATASTGEEKYTVTHTITAVLEGQLAGFALGTVTSGQYCYIQVSGLAWAKYRATVTDKTAGNLVQQVTTTATIDAVGDAVSAVVAGGGDTTHIGLKNIIGSAYDTPTDAGVKRINIKNLTLNI